MTKKPNILVYIGDDDPTRGDSHGWKGIGAEVADILNGDFHYVEKRLLDDFYPGCSDAKEKLKHYFNARGLPDIVMGTRSQIVVVRFALEGEGTPLFFGKYNESIAEDYLGSGYPVAHHLTPSLLKEEGGKLREAYPGLPSPLIALVFDEVPPTYCAEKLMSACAAYPQATVFLCGSRNTSAEDYDSVRRSLEQERRAKNLRERVRLEEYNFDLWKGKRRVYNPYIGLLNEADHVIVASCSHSLLSEPLAAGKRVIYASTSSLAHGMEKKGLARHFNNCADAVLEDDRIPPVSTARNIALEIAAKYKTETMAVS